MALAALLALLLVPIHAAHADQGNGGQGQGGQGQGNDVQGNEDHGSGGGTVKLLATIPFSLKPLGYDISWVEQSTGRYFLADSGNNEVDWFDANSTDPNTFLVQKLAQGAFAGSGTPTCKAAAPSPFGDCNGPNGVVTDDQHRVWAGDSPTGTTGAAAQSSVKVISTTAPFTYQTVSTGGKFRSDEMAFDSRDHVLLVANDVDGFLTWINTDTLQVIGKFYYDGNIDGQTPTFAGHVADNGLEQPVYDPSTGLFYQAVPGHGIDVFEPNPVKGVGQLIASYGTPGCVGTTSSGPTGLTLGPRNDLFGACPNGSVVVDATTGHNEALIPGVGGADEIWFNRGDGNVYYGMLKVLSVSPLNIPGTLGAVNGVNESFVAAISTGGQFSHSVAAFQDNNHIFVPSTGIGTSKTSGIQIFASSN